MKAILQNFVQTEQNNTPGEDGTEKIRLMLKSARDTNPNCEELWMVSTLFEEITGNLQWAGEIIKIGCKINPQSEDLWMQAMRLHPTDTVTAALAVLYKPNSECIWIKASNFQPGIENKRLHYKKALEQLPNSVRLWKAAVELEDPDDARTLLYTAVKHCNQSAELWLALARLEVYENARKILKRAMKNIPTDKKIAIEAAKLEEENGNNRKVKRIIDSFITSLITNGVEINRKDWFQEAIDAEKSGATVRCNAIISRIIDLAVEEEDREEAWMNDADFCENQKAFLCCSAIYSHALLIFPNKKNIFLVRILNVVKNFCGRELLENFIQQIVELCPDIEEFWLLSAKYKWMDGDVPGAIGVLSQGLLANPNSKNIRSALAQLEVQNVEFPYAQNVLLARRPIQIIKAAHRQWALNNLDVAIKLLDEGVDNFQDFSTFWEMKGQIQEQQQRLKDAAATYNRGVEICDTSIPLWLLSAKLEERRGLLANARSILDKGRFLNRDAPELWLEAIRLELRAGFKELASNMMVEALQACPGAGILWAEAIFMESKPQRKLKSLVALERCESKSHVYLASAKVYWAEQDFLSCSNFLNSAVMADYEFGDAWAYMYKFVLLYDSADVQRSVLERCIAARPKHGEHWCRVSKNIQNYRFQIFDIVKTVAEEIPIPT